jgi:hypothetical protein
LLEFGLVSTALLMLTLGVADLGRVFTFGNKAYSAASAGTMYGALSPAHYSDLAGMENAAYSELGNLPGATVSASQACRCVLGGPAIPCPAEANCTSGIPQTYIEVRVDIPYRSLSGLPWMPGLDRIRGKSVIRVQ